MTFSIRVTASALLLASLAACGSGGGGTSTPTPTPPPVEEQPASTSNRDLIDFASRGSSETLAPGVTRRSRAFAEDGVAGSVTVDRIAGSNHGLIQYRLGDDIFIYRLTGQPVANITAPSGNYNGPMNLNYRLDASSNWSVMSGEVNMLLDFESGELLIGGIASNDSGYGIEIFGDAQVVNGAFETDDMIVRLREGGVFLRDETGNAEGMIVSNDDRHAIFGLIGSENLENGFAMEGGFTGVLFRD